MFQLDVLVQGALGPVLLFTRVDGTCEMTAYLVGCAADSLLPVCILIALRILLLF
jgi:hypothetical protein